MEFLGDLLDDDNEKEEKGTTRDQEIRDQTNTNKKKNAEDDEGHFGTKKRWIE